jgi:general secretion pathway protein D
MAMPPVARPIPGGETRRAPAPSSARRKPGSADSDIHRVVPQKCVPAKGQFVWNFDEEELINILRQLSDLVCKTIVVNDSINKNMKLTIIGKSPLTPKDAWDVLMASMAAKGLALIEQGKTWTVVKRNESKNYSTPFYSRALNAANNEAIGTLFYKAEHASPESLRNISKMLVSKDGIVEVVGEQFIIVIDSNSNIRRLGRIFSHIDVEDAINKIHVLKIEHADVKTVEKQVRELFDLSNISGPPGMPPRRPRPGDAGKSGLNIKKVLADERTNSLIVEADSDSFEKLKEVVALVDQADTDKTNKGKIHVYRLRFADAEKVAETLNNVIKTGGRGRGGRFGRREEESSDVFEGDVQVTAHKSSNMIVAVANQMDYRSLLPTIMELDIRKDQVYIEAAIMDIRITDTNEFGINVFHGMKGPGDSLGFLANPGGRDLVSGLQNAAGHSSTAASALGLGAQSLGALAVLNNFINGGVMGLVGKPLANSNIPSFGAILQAFSTNANVDILSTPYLLTSDNQEAVMKVGQKVPTVKSISSLGGGAGSIGVPAQNVQYEPVELSFKVTPHVGADGNVRLDIEQEVNELGESIPLLSGKQNIINTKSAKTTIVLKDQQTGVIGGLMSNKTNKTDRKVPFLGDIPLLGWLFKSRESGAVKGNLVLVVTPTVIKTDEDYRKIYDKKLKEREEFTNLYYGGKIKTYNPYVDYSKKAGPLSSMLLSMDSEMRKPENGGPGDGTEIIIKPKDSDRHVHQVVPIVAVEPVTLQKEFGQDKAPVHEYMPEPLSTDLGTKLNKPEEALVLPSEPVQDALDAKFAPPKEEALALPSEPVPVVLEPEEIQPTEIQIDG